MQSPFLNPYEACRGEWVRGNIHGHTSEHSGCGSVPLLEGVDMYRAAGAAFIAVTDHDHVTDLAEARRRAPDMVFLEGFEYSTSENMLFVGERVPPLHKLAIGEALLEADGLLTVICHPRWRPGVEYWSLPMILALPRLPTGIEVYNGHYARPHVAEANPNPQYTGAWDELLERGLRLWGFASDDFHDPRDFGRAFNMACVGERTPAGVLEALGTGRFYATTGLLLEGLSVEGSLITVRLAGRARGRFVGQGGRVLSAGEGTAFSHSHGDPGYVRFEADSPDGMIFLQPLFPRGA